MPVDLQTLFQSDPAAQELGLKMIGDQRAQSQADLAASNFKNQRDQQMLPYDLKAAGLKNQIDEARLPQMFALTKKQQLDNQFDEATLDAKIKAELGNFRSKAGKQDLEQITQAGNAYVQAGQMLDLMPGVATHAYAKQLLGQYYHPSFDQVTPAALGQTISLIGKRMVEAQPGYLQKQGLEGLKIEGKNELADKKAERDKELAAFKATLSEKLAKLKADTVKSKDPATARAIANKLFLAAQQETDPDKKAELMEQAQGFNEIAFAEIERRAQATNANKPNLPALGIETNQMPPVPSLPGAQPQTASPQQTPKPASLADVQKMYPGVPADKLREAYKRKFGVDLQ